MVLGGFESTSRCCLFYDDDVVVCALFYYSNIAFKVESGLLTSVKSCPHFCEPLNRNPQDAFTAVNFLLRAEAVRHGRPPRALLKVDSGARRLIARDHRSLSVRQLAPLLDGANETRL